MAMLSSEPLGIFSAFTFYYLSERFLRYFFQKKLHSSKFQAALHSSRKDTVYFGILLGAFISIFSFPFCANTLWQYHPLSIITKNVDKSLSADICVMSRAVLWISELNRLDLYPQYVFHHLGSIVALLSAQYLEAVELLYLPFTTLVTEVPGDLVWLLAAHREMDPAFKNNGKLERYRTAIRTVNWWMYMLVRVPSIPAVIYSTVIFTQRNKEAWSDRGSRALVSWVCLVMTLYAGWVFTYLKKEQRTLKGASGHAQETHGSVQQVANRIRGESSLDFLPPSSKDNNIVSSGEREGSGSSSSKNRTILYSFQHPIHVRFPSGLILTLYGPLMGIALSNLAIVAFLLSPPPITSFRDISLSLFIIVFFAILFARILSLIYEDTIGGFLRNPKGVFLRPGFWLHGGIIGAGLGLILTWSIGLIEGIEQLGLALCVGLPLYEVFSRLGCHTYGCCFGQTIDKFASPFVTQNTLLSIFSPVVYTSPSAAAVRTNPNLRNVPLFPIQKISSTLFALQFLIFWSLVIQSSPKSVNLVYIGAGSLVCHAVLRLWAEAFREDFRGVIKELKFGSVGFKITATGRLALLQILIGLSIASRRTLVSLITGETVKYIPERISLNELGALSVLKDPWTKGCLLFIFGLGTAVYGLHSGEIGRGMVTG